MQRLLVALLAAFDAAIAAAVGLVVLLAPLTLLWTLAFGVTADWGALWPLTGTLWEFGHGVPLEVTIPDELLVALAIPPQAASFAVSITPLAFLLFTLLFAARSGARAAAAGTWLLGSVSGTVVFAAISTGVALTARLDAVQTPWPSRSGSPPPSTSSVRCAGLSGSHGKRGMAESSTVCTTASTPARIGRPSPSRSCAARPSPWSA